METAAIILSGASLLIAIVILILLLLNGRRDGSAELRMELNNSMQAFGQTISENQRSASQSQDQRLNSMEQSFALDFERLRKSQEDRLGTMEQSNEQRLQAIRQTMETRLTGFGSSNEQKLETVRTGMETRLTSMEQNNDQKLEAIRQTIERRLTAMQTENQEKLAQMQKVVDEKLQQTLETRITESFKVVSSQLEEVYKGLGEMQSVAAGVTDLKNVLTHVKKRGILGEMQLSGIITEILAPEQYEANAETIPGTGKRVEFAVRLPGDGENTVFLPIDSKFPGESYAKLVDAYDSGDANLVKKAADALITRLKAEAKDIKEKYIEAPYTTDFGILFLPFEGLYAEAVNRGMIEELSRTYRVIVTGPSTLAAFLNSLQMGFRTLAIQKRSGEIWQLLGAVKSEFEKFGSVLEDSQNKLREINDNLDDLVGKRTRQINKHLRDVQRLNDDEAKNLLEA